MATYNGSDKRLEYLFLNGGGGGGGTTVVANPAGDATDDLEKLQVSSTIYKVPTAIGGVGLFVDTNNIIQANTAIPANTDVSYTATQDCFVRYSLVTAANAQAMATIDGVTVFTTYIPSNVGVMTLGDSAYLKKGQTIKFNQSYTQSDGSYTVYGLLRGSEGGIYLPSCYSSEERQVGVFTDGKPLYQKTIYLSSVTSGQYYAHGITGVDKIWVYDVKANRNTGWFSSEHIFSSNGTVSESFSVIANDTYIYPIVYSNTITECYVTVQYTKTTDTAGGGIWTPNGGEAHHYSTDEQIIGTWIDGETAYEKTFKWTTAMSIPVNGTWYNTNVNISYVKKIIDASVGNDTWNIGVFSVFKNGQIMNMTSAGAMGSNTLSVNRVTLRYTKNTT